MAIIRCAKGLLAICGICKNSSRSIDPDPSLSSFMNRFLSRKSSGPETRGVGSGYVHVERAFTSSSLDLQLDQGYSQLDDFSSEL